MAVYPLPDLASTWQVKVLSEVKDEFYLVTHGFQFDFAPENPIDANRIGQDDGHSNAGDNQHDAQCFLR